MTTMEERLKRLEDEQAIIRTLYAYGHSLDYGLEDKFLDCWTENAVLHWPPEPLVGKEAIRGAFRAHTHIPAAYHKHFVVEPEIVITGDEARVDSMFARIDHYEDGPHFCAFGRYRDILVRCPDGRWRFRERRTEVESFRGSTGIATNTAR